MGATHIMAAEDAASILGRLAAHEAEVCVGGGRGVDALLQQQTRPHSDLDIWVPAAHPERLFRAASELSIDRVFAWPGDRPWNFVLNDGDRTRLDLHLCETLPDVSFRYGSAVDGVVFPAGALAGEGVIAGIVVGCEAAEWAVRWRTGYPPRDGDRHDVPLICQRFGIEMPEGFR